MKQDNIVSIWLGNFMKKIILIFFSLLCISCSQLDTYPSEEERAILTTIGVSKLLNEDEKKTLASSKFVNFASIHKFFDVNSKNSAFKKEMYNDIISGPRLTDKTIKLINMYYDKIIVADNLDLTQRAIEKMGKTIEGRATLAKCRFVFFNYDSEEKVKELSKEYGFKYIFPKFSK